MIPSYTIPFELTDGLVAFDIACVSGGSFDIVVAVTEDNAVYNIADTTWTFRYTDQNETWEETISGSISGAAGLATFAVREDITQVGNFRATIEAVYDSNDIFQLVGSLKVNARLGEGPPPAPIVQWVKTSGAQTIADVKTFTSSPIVPTPTTDFQAATKKYVDDADALKQDILAEGAFVDGDKTKLDGIETGADVTDTANVTSAGALMDSEVTNLAQVKAFDSADYLGATELSLIHI